MRERLVPRDGLALLPRQRPLLLIFWIFTPARKLQWRLDVVGHAVWATRDEARIIKLQHDLYELSQVPHRAANTQLEHALYEIVDREALVLNIHFDCLVQREVMVRQVSLHHQLRVLFVVLEPGVEQVRAELDDLLVVVVHRLRIRLLHLLIKVEWQVVLVHDAIEFFLGW